MKPNTIRDKALANLTEKERARARAAWSKICSDPRCHGKVARAARLAMLTVLADGGSIAAAKKAGKAVLA